MLGRAEKPGRTDIRRRGPANLLTDFCNKIGTKPKSLALQRFRPESGGQLTCVGPNF
jgi:hypothetical protein